MNTESITVVGGGLAGSEAAWQIARAGLRARLCEMRPLGATGAHRTDRLAELVCSNSLGSTLPDRASGVLISELRALDSLLLRCARETALPAGGALAVDREAFAGRVTAALESAPGVEIVRGEVTALPAGPAVIASGPLTSPPLAEALRALTGDHLYFFDAIAPVVRADSIDPAIAFRASRWNRGAEEEGDYLNCPFTREEYERFVDALLGAERAPLREFERAVEQGGGVRAGEGPYFEGCLPVEVLAARGKDTLAFGPMRPVGLRDPRTGRRPHAVVQLRQDNLAGDLYNLVGFQTNLRAGEQERVFRLIPGLERAVFVRHGQMHRNTFVNAPMLLDSTFEFRCRPGLFLAGQLTGVEGYLGNIATGLLAGVNAARKVQGRSLLTPPPETMLGALCRYVSAAEPATFQPMKANMGILPPLPAGPRGKRPRAAAHAARAAEALRTWRGGAGM